MAEEIISKRTRDEFREYLVGTTLREIATEFEGVGIRCSVGFDPQTSGERRSLVERYYRSVDFTKWEDCRKVLRAFENILTEIEEFQEGPWTKWPAEDRATQVKRLARWLEKDGFVYESGRIRSVSNFSASPKLRSMAVSFDATYISNQVRLMEAAIDTDPRLAIGTAKELIETTCKTILVDRGRDCDKNWTISKLVKETLKELKLAPDDVPDSVAAADTIQRLLGNLANVTHCLAELRNPYGTGHGPEGRARGLAPRHARLAVGSATTFATFLLETFQARGVVATRAS